MLLVPYLAGVIVAGWRWPDGPLLGALLAGYPLSYYALQAIKTRRVRRVGSQLAFHGAVAVPLATLVAAVRPGVLVLVPGFVGLLAVNAWYAWRRRERALVNDLVWVLQGGLVVLAVALVAGEQPFALTAAARALPAAAVVVGYFVGTVLFVKTMIRECGNPVYRRWSIGYHCAATVAAAGYAAAAGWRAAAVVVLFGWLTGRAWVLAGRALRPAQVGAAEVGNTALLLAALAILTV